MSDCSERIGRLKDAPLFYSIVPAEVAEMAKELDDTQIRMWCLLSMARLARLGERLAALDGCKVMGQIGWAVDTILRLCQFPAIQEEFERKVDEEVTVPIGRNVARNAFKKRFREDYGILSGLPDRFFDFSYSDVFLFNNAEVSVPGGAPFQVLDLNGMGVLSELVSFLGNTKRAFESQRNNETPPLAVTGIIGCTMPLDYFARTLGGNPEDVRQVKAERQRIWYDCEFVRGHPTWKAVERQAAMYKDIDILEE